MTTSVPDARVKLVPATARLVIPSDRNSVRPMHLFDRNCDHDYHFELLWKEGRGAHSIALCPTAHHDDVRAAPRANRTQCTADNPIPGASARIAMTREAWVQPKSF